MLTCNLWEKEGLVNGAIVTLQNIYYCDGSKPPQLLMYITVCFDYYIGIPWDVAAPKIVPITIPISRGNQKQIPLCMARALSIHKSQGLTLEKVTIDIGNTERQGLTFRRILRVKSIDGLSISPPFTFERYSKMSQSAYATIRKKEE